MAVVNAPLLGKASQTGMERCIGSMLGGLCGYLFFLIGELFWNEQTDGLVLMAGASLVAFSAVVVGHYYKLDASARLFIITYLLVTFTADRGKDAGALAFNRVCGILAGVILILLLSICVFPKSASVECVRNVEKALDALGELNSLAWSSYVLGTDEFDRIPGSKSQRNLQGLAMYRTPPVPGLAEGAAAGSSETDVEMQRSLLGEATSHGAARLAAEDALEARVEEVITAVYQACFKLLENMKLADAEWYLGSSRGSPIFAPDPPLCLARPTAMPLEELAEVGTAIRRTARLMTQLVNTLGYGFRAELQEMLGDAFPDALMRRLGIACQAVTQEMARAWPDSAAVAPAPIVSFVSTVAALVSTSDRQRLQIIRALKKHRPARPGRVGWDVLRDALARRQAGGRGRTTGDYGEGPRILSAPTLGPSLLRTVSVDSNGGEGAAPGEPGRTPSWLAAAGGGGDAPKRPPLPAVARKGDAVEGKEPLASSGRVSPEYDVLQFRLSLPQIQTGRASEDADGARAQRSVREQDRASQPLQQASPTVAGASPRGLEAALASGSRPGMSRRSIAASSVASESSVIRRTALRAASLAEGSPGLAALLNPVAGVDASSPHTLAEGFDSGLGLERRLGLHLFPETPEGRVAQVRWYSFQFLVEELTEEISALQEALNACLAKLPRY